MEQPAVASCFGPIGNATVIMLSRIEFTRLLGAIKGDTILTQSLAPGLRLCIMAMFTAVSEQEEEPQGSQDNV